MQHLHQMFFTMILLINLLSCNDSVEQPEKEEPPIYPELIEVASSNYLWTGVAVSQDGRIFVCFPRWSRTIQMSVAELLNGVIPKPYPDNEWNNWSNGTTAINHFVCVQSVYIDKENFLWILDTGNPQLNGVIDGGAKLIKIDLNSNIVVNVFELGFTRTDTYLNDVRIDNTKYYAYLTDSGLGRLCIIDILSGDKKIVLYSHPSTKAEDITLTVEGISYERPVHVDGLAIDPMGEYLYYQALRGRNLYRIHTSWLNIRDTILSENDLAGKVEHVSASVASDGIEFGSDGNLYLSSIEANAIRRYVPGRGVEMVIQDIKIKWPDSFSITKDSTIYFTISQIHRISNPSGSFKLFKIKPFD